MRIEHKSPLTSLGLAATEAQVYIRLLLMVNHTRTTETKEL
jgi:hypothetical protein